MQLQRFFNQVGAQFMKIVLRSPLHVLLSRSVVLLTVKGRKSGKAYTIPVNYLRQGDLLTIVSLRSRTWWRNLRGGSPVTLHLQGQDVEGWGTVIEDDYGVAEGLKTRIQQAPQYAKYFNVTLDSTGQPRSEDINLAAKIRVVIQVKIKNG
jgi:deazaflavin-dependent oxidoreductase (nitroreductase family)